MRLLALRVTQTASENSGKPPPYHSQCGNTLPAPSEDRSLFWPLQLAGWGLFGAGMFAAGVSHWPVAYAAVVKSSLTLFGFAASLVLRAVYRELLRRNVPSSALVAA